MGNMLCYNCKKWEIIERQTEIIGVLGELSQYVRIWKDMIESIIRNRANDIRQSLNIGIPVNINQICTNLYIKL